MRYDTDWNLESSNNCVTLTFTEGSLTPNNSVCIHNDCGVSQYPCRMDQSSDPSTVLVTVNNWTCCTEDLRVCINGQLKHTFPNSGGSPQSKSFEIGKHIFGCSSEETETAATLDSIEVKCGDLPCNETTGGVVASYTLQEMCLKCPAGE